MGAAWRRARRAAGRRRVVDDPREGGSSARPKAPAGSEGDGGGSGGGDLAATTAAVKHRRCSRIQWDTKFHARQASKVMSEDAARPEATGATLASSTIGMRQEPSRLRWHFYSNLLLSLMREGLDVKSLPDSIDKSYLQGLMRGQFQEEQYAAARGRNNCITRDQVWEFVPSE